MYAPHASTSISWLSAYGYPLKHTAGGLNVVCGGTLSNSSDARLKSHVQEIDFNECQLIFDSVTPKSYQRVDYDTDKRRCGFIAQEVQAALPTTDFQNIVTTYEHGVEEKTEMLSLDYSRMAAVVLWGVVKNYLRYY